MFPAVVSINTTERLSLRFPLAVKLMQSRSMQQPMMLNLRMLAVGICDRVKKQVCHMALRMSDKWFFIS